MTEMGFKSGAISHCLYEQRLYGSSTRVVKILMRLPDGNISTAHLSVTYNGPIRQHDCLLLLRLEITVHCLCPDDSVRHDNGSGNRAAHVLATFRQIKSASTNSRP